MTQSRSNPAKPDSAKQHKFSVNEIRFNFQPVIIIGAARSGTNMLRDMLTRLPGVGKKTAERLVVEMRDKLDKVSGGAGGAGDAAVVIAGAGPAAADQDAVSALIALGYRPPEASRMVSKVFQEGMDTEAIIRAALKGSVQ